MENTSEHYVNICLNHFLTHQTFLKLERMHMSIELAEQSFMSNTNSQEKPLLPFTFSTRQSAHLPFPWTDLQRHMKHHTKLPLLNMKRNARTKICNSPCIEKPESIVCWWKKQNKHQVSYHKEGLLLPLRQRWGLQQHKKHPSIICRFDTWVGLYQLGKSINVQQVVRFLHRNYNWGHNQGSDRKITLQDNILVHQFYNLSLNLVFNLCLSFTLSNHYSKKKPKPANQPKKATPKSKQSRRKNIGNDTLNAFYPSLGLFCKEELTRLSNTVTVGKEILNLLLTEIIIEYYLDK